MLDFDAEKNHRSIGTSKESDNNVRLTESNLSVLIDSLLLYLEENPMCLTHPYPSNSQRFLAIRLDNLLKPSTEERAELRRKYHNGLARVLLKQFESDQENNATQSCSWTLANHLLNNIDAQYTDKELKTRLLNGLQ